MLYVAEFMAEIGTALSFFLCLSPLHSFSPFCTNIISRLTAIDIANRDHAVKF